jgi:hypothetical protein
VVQKIIGLFLHASDMDLKAIADKFKAFNVGRP